MSWEIYFENVKNRSLRNLYVRAIEYADQNSSKIAMDLGCGVGTEVIDLLNRGFKVHALDKELKAIEFLKPYLTKHENKLELHLTSIEDFKSWCNIDFLFAYQSLPFVSKKYFPIILESITQSISENGIFAANFFGNDHQWVKEKKAVGVSIDDLKKIFINFKEIYINETKEIKQTAIGDFKKWHAIDLIVKNHKNFY